MAIGKVQLCRAHGGGARANKNKMSAKNEVLLPMVGDGTFCVPIIEPIMDGYGQQQQKNPNIATDFANL